MSTNKKPVCPKPVVDQVQKVIIKKLAMSKFAYNFDRFKNHCLNVLLGISWSSTPEV